MSKIQDLRGITPRTNGTRSLSQVKNVARHHSGTDTGDWFTFWPFWRDQRGWGTGGYSEIILRDGTTQLCYDPHEITNGVAGHNTSVYNICLVGNGSFTAAQEKAWHERCHLALKRFNLPISAVKGHNEFSGANTACPGINMNTVRSALAKNTAVTPAPTVNPASTGSIVEYLNALGRDSSFTARAKLALGYGISGYTGTAAQNTLLLERMRANWKPTPAPKPVAPVSKPKEEVPVPKETPAWKVEYDRQVKRAKELGFTDGTRPKEPLTREEGGVIAVRVYEAAEKLAKK